MKASFVMRLLNLQDPQVKCENGNPFFSSSQWFFPLAVSDLAGIGAHGLATTGVNNTVAFCTMALTACQGNPSTGAYRREKCHCFGGSCRYSVSD